MNIIKKVAVAAAAAIEEHYKDAGIGVEKSFYKSPYYDKSYDMPYNPDDLVKIKGGLQVYEKMKLTDDQVKACLFVKKNAVIHSGWEIQAAGEEKAQQEQKDYISYIIGDGLSGTFQNKLLDLQTCYEYGFSGTEIVPYVIDTGRFKGKYGIQHMKTRPPHSFEFDQDDYGNVTTIKQHGPMGTIEIDPKWFIVYSYNQEFGNPYGNSDLRAAYRPWFSKDITIRFRNIFNERFGMPTVVGKYPKGANKTDRENLKKVIKNIQAKTGISIPDNVVIELLEATRRGTADYQPAIENYDKAIAKSILIPNLLGFTEMKFGSRSLGQEHGGIFEIVVEYLQKDLAGIINDRLVKPYIIWNYGPQEVYPEFKFKPINPDSRAEVLELFLKAKEKSLITVSNEDEIWIRDLLNAPKLQEDAEELPRNNKVIGIPGMNPAEPKKGQEVKKAGKEDPSKEIPDEEGKFASKRLRPINKYERKFNFTEAEETLNNNEEVAVEEQSRIMENMLDGIKNSVVTKKIVERKSPAAVDEVVYRGLGDIRKTWQHYLRLLYTEGRSQAQKTIGRKSFAADPNINLPPSKAFTWFDKQAFEMAATTNNKIQAEVKQVLLDAIEYGNTTSEVVYEIEKIFQPYVEGGIIFGISVKPYLLNTLARTNFSTSYNMGMLEDYQNEPFVKAYEYSAVLDMHTTDYCRAMDKQIYVKENPSFRVPPAHYNCRSLIIPVLADEDYLKDLSTQDPGKPQKISPETGQRMKETAYRPPNFGGPIEKGEEKNYG